MFAGVICRIRWVWLSGCSRHRNYTLDQPQVPIYKGRADEIDRQQVRAQGASARVANDEVVHSATEYCFQHLEVE